MTADTTLYAQWTAPTVTLSNPTVAQGGTLVVTGANFGGSQTLDISIHSDPVHLATVTTDGAGGFTTTVTIPTTLAPGAHTLTVTGGPSGPISAAVTVTPVVLGLTGTDIWTPLWGALALTLLGGVLSLIALRTRWAR